MVLVSQKTGFVELFPRFDVVEMLHAAANLGRDDCQSIGLRWNVQSPAAFHLVSFGVSFSPWAHWTLGLVIWLALQNLGTNA